MANVWQQNPIAAEGLTSVSTKQLHLVVTIVIMAPLLGHVHLCASQLAAIHAHKLHVAVLVWDESQARDLQALLQQAGSHVGVNLQRSCWQTA